MSGKNPVEMIIEEKKEEGQVDRQKVCPFLLRVFVSANGYHHKLSDYMKGNVPENELQIYTWRDASLNELSLLVKKVSPEARRKGTVMSFAFVFPEIRSPGYRMREIGSTTTGQKGPDDLKTLGLCRFTIGDYMDIAITLPDQWKGGLRKPYVQPFINRARQY